MNLRLTCMPVASNSAHIYDRIYQQAAVHTATKPIKRHASTTKARATTRVMCIWAAWQQQNGHGPTCPGRTKSRFITADADAILRSQSASANMSPPSESSQSRLAAGRNAVICREQASHDERTSIPSHSIVRRSGLINCQSAALPLKLPGAARCISGAHLAPLLSSL